MLIDQILSNPILVKAGMLTTDLRGRLSRVHKFALDRGFAMAADEFSTDIDNVNKAFRSHACLSTSAGSRLHKLIAASSLPHRSNRVTVRFLVLVSCVRCLITKVRGRRSCSGRSQRARPSLATCCHHHSPGTC
jgi:hypothetical protein